MGNLIIKVEDETGKPIPSAHFEGKSACAYCVINCHDVNLSGDSNSEGKIIVNDACGWGGGHAWGYVWAEGYTKVKIDTDLDYWGGDTLIHAGLHAVDSGGGNGDNGGCTHNSDCPTGYICENNACVKTSHHSMANTIEQWIKENWVFLLVVGIALIILFIYFMKGKKGGGYSLTKAYEGIGKTAVKTAGSISQGVSQNAGIIKDLAVLGA